MLNLKNAVTNSTSSDDDPIWHVQLTIFIALLLQLFLTDKFVAGPRLALPILELLVLISLFLTTRKRMAKNHVLRKLNTVSLIIFI
jgi:hypothetical protein